MAKDRSIFIVADWGTLVFSSSIPNYEWRGRVIIISYLGNSIRGDIHSRALVGELRLLVFEGPAVSISLTDRTMKIACCEWMG